MASRLTKVLVVVGGLTVSGIWQGYAQSSNSSAQPTANLAHSQAQAPHGKEAQKHYLIAVEALKNNDLTTALQELNAAAELAPKNALIWYNLAVVESKKGDSAQAIKYLQKAESFGLPKGLLDEVGKLSAELTYKTENEAKGTPAQSEKTPEAAPPTGPTLSETFDFLGRILPANEARVTARRVYSDYRRYSQDQFIFDTPSACLFSWDTVQKAHFADGTPPVQGGRTENDVRDRLFILLKNVLLSDVKVMDFRAYATSPLRGVFVPGFEVGDDVEYDGYVLVVKGGDRSPTEDLHVPNPNNVNSYRPPNVAFFFSTVDDANRTQKAIVHAATLCGAKADVF